MIGKTFGGLKRAALFATIALAVLTLATCDGESPTSPVGGSSPAAVGSTGGAVALGTEASVVILPESLSSTVTIGIAAVSTPPGFAEAGAIGQAYSFTPVGLVFGREATISIRVPNDVLGGNDPDRLVIVTTRPAGAATVEALSDITVEQGEGSVRVRGLTNHFSVFQAAFSNRAPTADAGPDQDVFVGQRVTLRGQGDDPDGDPVAFDWLFELRPPDSGATLQGANSPTPSFVAGVMGAYVVSLRVSDGQGLAATDSVRIIASPAPNNPPTANAGPDQQVVVGQTVTLDGQAGDPDGDPITLEWSFDSLPSGSTAALENPNGPTPTFVADLMGTYVVRLTVTDTDDATATDNVVVTAEPVSNGAPVANAGPDQQVMVGATVLLNGTGSDPDGDPLGFNWTFDIRPGGSTAIIQNPSAANATFIPDLPGSYVVRLTVDDGRGGMASDTAAITVSASPTVVEVQLLSTLQFSPAQVTIAVGTTIRWRNAVSIFHTVTPDGHTEFMRATFSNIGDTFEHTFNTPGTFDYFCEPHVFAGMRGTIIVQ